MTSEARPGAGRALQLGTRLTATMTLVLILASSVLFFRLTARERERLVDSKCTGASMVTRLAATSLSAAVDVGDADDVAGQLAYLKSSPEIAAAAVWRNGEPVAEWRSAKAPTLGVRHAGESVGPRVTPDWIETTEPIVNASGVPIARLQVVFSLARENETYRQSRLLILWISLALVIVTASIHGLIVRHQIIRPLSRLGAVVRRWEQGELCARVEVDVNDEIGALAGAFNRMGDAVALRQGQVEAAEARFRTLIETMPDAVTLHKEGKIIYSNPSFHDLLGARDADLLGVDLKAILPGRAGPPTAAAGAIHEERWTVGGRAVLVEVRERAVTEGGSWATMLIARDVTERRQLQTQLMQSEKLAAIGTLAAGVAHEINTPVQFVSDSLDFVRDGLQDLTALLERHREVSRAVQERHEAEALATAALSADASARLPYLRENMPPALERIADGLGRIATIVRSLKVFAHPDRQSMAPADLNRAIESTLIMSRSEYRYVADVITDLGDLPPVTCFAGEVNQAILNIIVNASHAIADNVNGTARRGQITIRSRLVGDAAVIDIGDTGGGIPEAVRTRIFDPFFTTKEVGKGTGQGLAIARAVVVEKHGGELTFDTELGKGTTFHLKLPVRHTRQQEAPSERGSLHRAGDD
jgi:PAS domain S-box-containing protein